MTRAPCLLSRYHSFSGPGWHSGHLHCSGGVHLALQKEEEVSWFGLRIPVLDVWFMYTRDDWPLWRQLCRAPVCNPHSPRSTALETPVSSSLRETLVI